MTPTNPGELASTGDARHILGVPASSISRWLENGTMPQPYDVTAAGPIWLREKLVEFRDERGARRPRSDAK